MNKIDEVAIENTEGLIKDKLFNDIGMNIVSFLKKFRRICEKMGIKVIFVNPRGTSKLCPKCNRKLKKLGSNFYFLYCKNCKLILDEDEVGSWNILN